MPFDPDKNTSLSSIGTQRLGVRKSSKRKDGGAPIRVMKGPPTRLPNSDSTAVGGKKISRKKKAPVRTPRVSRSSNPVKTTTTNRKTSKPSQGTAIRRKGKVTSKDLPKKVAQFDSFTSNQIKKESSRISSKPTKKKGTRKEFKRSASTKKAISNRKQFLSSLRRTR